MALERKFRFPTELLLWGLLVVGGGYLLGVFMYTDKAAYILQRMQQWGWEAKDTEVLGVRDDSNPQTDIVKMLDFWVEYPLCSHDNPGEVVFKFQPYREEVMDIRVVLEFPQWMQVRPALDGRRDFGSNSVYWDLQLEPYIVREVAVEIYGPLYPRSSGYIRAKVFVGNELVGQYQLPISTVYECSNTNNGRRSTNSLTKEGTTRAVSNFRKPINSRFSLVLEDTDTINCACYNKTGTFYCKYYKEVDANIRCETWCKSRGFEFGEKTTCEDLSVIYGQ